MSVLPDGALGQFPMASFVGAAAEDETLGFESLEAAFDDGFGDAEPLGIAGIGEGAVLLDDLKELGGYRVRIYRVNGCFRRVIYPVNSSFFRVTGTIYWVIWSFYRVRNRIYRVKLSAGKGNVDIVGGEEFLAEEEGVEVDITSAYKPSGRELGSEGFRPAGNGLGQ